jgi:alpha-1,2-mannosyltransferase
MLWAAVLFAAALFAVVWYLVTNVYYRIDLDVYRIGVQTWIAGGDLYATLPQTQAGISLPFLYPPIAAALLVPFAVIPYSLASVAFTLVTVAAVTLTLMIVLDATGLPRRWLLVLPGALMLEPIRSTVDFGQVNGILMLLVVADCLVRDPRWPRGALIGVAAAIKLTPIAFLLFFLIRREYRPVVTAVASFLATTFAGFLLAWHESAWFWTQAVLHTSDRINVNSVANQSITGVLTRMGVTTTPTWLIIAAAVVTAAVLGMRTASRPLALSINALAVLLVSPISWTHHWVWCVPVLLSLYAAGHHVLAACGLVVFAVSPHKWFGLGPYDSGQLALIATYFGFALVVLAMVRRRKPGGQVLPLFRSIRTRDRGPVTAPPRS